MGSDVVNKFLDILLKQWLEHSVQRTTVMMFVIKTSYVATLCKDDSEVKLW